MSQDETKLTDAQRRVLNWLRRRPGSWVGARWINGVRSSHTLPTLEKMGFIEGRGGQGWLREYRAMPSTTAEPQTTTVREN